MSLSRNFGPLNSAQAVTDSALQMGMLASSGRPTFLNMSSDTDKLGRQNREKFSDAKEKHTATAARLVASTIQADRPKRKDRLVALANPKLAADRAKIRQVLEAGFVSGEDEYNRAEADLPISEDSSPSDTTLFESPDDSGEKLYLPRYRMRAQGGRYDIAVAKADNETWWLRVGLERFVAPELVRKVKGAIKGATVLAHQIAVFMQFGAGPTGSIQKRIEFTEREETEEGVTVSAALTLPERDQLLHAIQSHDSGAQLVVRRAVELAVRKPVTKAADSARKKMEEAIQEARQTKAATEQMQGEAQAQQEAIQEAHSEAQEAAQSEMHGGGVGAKAQLQKAQVLVRGKSVEKARIDPALARKLSARPLALEKADLLKRGRIFGTRDSARVRVRDHREESSDKGRRHHKARAERGSPRVKVRDHRDEPSGKERPHHKAHAERGETRVKVRDHRNEGEPSQEPRYETRGLALDDVVDPDPFFLDPQLHAYFYDAIGGAQSGSEASFRRIVLAYPEGEDDARFHAYFQDQGRPWTFYYLPDQFRLARRDASPFFPQMVVRVASPDGAMENAEVTVDYVVEPSVDPDRLASAMASLQPEIPGAVGEDRSVDLRPLQAQARYKLRLPEPSGSVLRAMEDVSIDLANGFVHSFTLPMEGFQEGFAAALSRDATSFFTGSILVETGLAAPEQIPASIRFADTEGEVIDIIDIVEQTDGGALRIGATNAIESPVKITALPIRLRRDGVEADARIVKSAPDSDFPMELAPGAEFRIGIEPESGLPGEGVPEIIFDTQGVKILPDPDTILPAISDTSVPAHYVREIDVMTRPELLGEEGDPESILLVNVEFKGGGAARVEREAPETSAQVSLPLADVLLGKDVEGRYAFKQQIVRRNGSQTVDNDWREADFGLLVVPMT